MQYNEYEVLEPLKPFVKVIWSMENDSQIFGGSSMHILPDTWLCGVVLKCPIT
jgi:hypothetical protein